MGSISGVRETDCVPFLSAYMIADVLHYCAKYPGDEMIRIIALSFDIFFIRDVVAIQYNRAFLRLPSCLKRFTLPLKSAH
jgi:hypothetical protein